MAIPVAAHRVVETPRLTLRPFTAADIPAYAAIRAKPQVVRFLPGGEAGAAGAAETAARLVADFATQWDRIGYGPWAVAARDTGRLLGHAGLRLLPEFHGETEILYMLDTVAWGRGLATEAAAAARDYGFATAGLDRLIALTRPDNAGSIRVMQKIGMRCEGEVAVFGFTALCYALGRSGPSEGDATHAGQPRR